MKEYISREAAMNFELSVKADPTEIQAITKGMALYAEHIKSIPAADVAPVVRCRECKYWRDAYIQQSDGRERKYPDKDVDALGIPNYVTIDVGINVGAKCRVEDNRGWDEDKSVFRHGDDYCSRGERRPVPYDEWWGIVDGFYPVEKEAQDETD